MTFPCLSVSRRSYLNDVWKSADGREWVEVCKDAEWVPRRGHSAVVFGDRVYLVGGDTGSACASDIWVSDDCEHWELVCSEKPWCSRIGHSVVAHRWDHGG
jgi:hypothetical protein